MKLSPVAQSSGDDTAYSVGAFEQISLGDDRHDCAGAEGSLRSSAGQLQSHRDVSTSLTSTTADSDLSLGVWWPSASHTASAPTVALLAAHEWPQTRLSTHSYAGHFAYARRELDLHMFPVLSVQDPFLGDGWKGGGDSNVPISYSSSVGIGRRQTLVNNIEIGDFAYYAADQTSDPNVSVLCDWFETNADAEADSGFGTGVFAVQF